jgi:hypothetical protein
MTSGAFFFVDTGRSLLYKGERRVLCFVRILRPCGVLVMFFIAIVSLLKLVFVPLAPFSPTELAALANYEKTGDPSQCKILIRKLENEIKEARLETLKLWFIFIRQKRIVMQLTRLAPILDPEGVDPEIYLAGNLKPYIPHNSFGIFP